MLKQLNLIVDLDSPEVWLHEWVFFKQTVPMAMDNLSIAQHRHSLHYAHIHSLQYACIRMLINLNCKFLKGDFVNLEREVPTTLNVKIWHTILHVKEVLYLRGRMDKNAENILRIALMVTFPLRDFATRIGGGCYIPLLSQQ